MTRKEYLAPFISSDEAATRHRKYYAQFVTEGVLLLVEKGIGAERIAGSKDGAFNDIPLHRWDALVSSLHTHGVAARLKELGDYLTLGTGVCVLKEAAKQLKEREVR